MTEIILVTPNTLCRMDYHKGIDSSDEEDSGVTIPDHDHIDANIDNVCDVTGDIPMNESLNETLIDTDRETSDDANDSPPLDSIINLPSTSNELFVQESSKKSTRARNKPAWLRDYDTS